MSNDKLEEMLDSIKRKSEPSGGLNENNDKEEAPRRGELQKVEDVRSTIALNNDESKQLGLVNKMKANHLKSKKQLEAQEVIFDTQISRLKHQAEATERQSKAYWDAKSVDFAEGLKTYAQQNMQLLENARQENKSTAIIDAYMTADVKMKEIMEKSIPDSVKMELVSKIKDVRDATVERLENDTLANKYDLGPEK
jgi:hypothetical protein